MSEWKPGDVAVVGWGALDEDVMVRNAHNAGWNGAFETVMDVDDDYIGARPLVVIDPEDAEQVGMLAALYDTVTHGEVTSRTPMNIRELRMQAALREFANPTPPDPAPTYTDAEARAMREAIRRIERGGGS